MLVLKFCFSFFPFWMPAEVSHLSLYGYKQRPVANCNETLGQRIPLQAQGARVLWMNNFMDRNITMKDG